MRSPFDPFVRDGHPGLVDTEIREAAITRARFCKAVKLADVLTARPRDWADPEHLTPEQWAAAMVVAGIASASPSTRVLVVELLKDRERQMEGLMDEVEAIEHVRLNYEPGRVRTTGMTERDLLRQLAIDNPWSLSTEGLDDCCLFCHSEDRRYRDGRYTYVHEDKCVWLEAREYLGMSQAEHLRKSQAKLR